MLTLLENLPSAYLSAQLKDGIILMLLGMIVVFIFLTILIYSIKLMSKIVGNNAPAEEPKKKVAAKPATVAKSNDDEKIAVAIAASLDKGRN